MPFFVSLTFVLTTFATLTLFYLAMDKPKVLMLWMVTWLGIQGVLAFTGIYFSDTTALPPRILLFGMLPAMVAVVVPFLIPKGRIFMDNLSLIRLTYVHVVRIPVEIVLWWLFLNGAVPQVMTFEGWNFDIIAGLTAPVVAYFWLGRNPVNRNAALVWNIVCVALLLNIVVLAFLSAPSPLQRIAFDQPNIALLNFPFQWLPTFIVPIVLFSHFVAIRKLVVNRD